MLSLPQDAMLCVADHLNFREIITWRATCKTLRETLSLRDVFCSVRPRLEKLRELYPITSCFYLGTLADVDTHFAHNWSVSLDKPLFNTRYIEDFTEALGFLPSVQQRNLALLDGTWRIMIPEASWMTRTIRLRSPDIRLFGGGGAHPDLATCLGHGWPGQLAVTELCTPQTRARRFNVSGPAQPCFGLRSLLDVFYIVRPRLAVLDLVMLSRVSTKWHRTAKPWIEPHARACWNQVMTDVLLPDQREHLRMSNYVVSGSFVMNLLAGRPHYPTDIDVWARPFTEGVPVTYPHSHDYLDSDGTVRNYATRSPELQLQIITRYLQGRHRFLPDPENDFDISVCRCALSVIFSANFQDPDMASMTVRIADPEGLVRMQGTYSVFTPAARLAKYRARGYQLLPEATGFDL